MNRTKLLAITTVLIAVIAVIGVAYGLKGGVKPLKGVYVSGANKWLYVLDPDTTPMTVIASKDVKQSALFPSNQYPGDKYIWIPGGGASGLTIVDSKNLNVACWTGYKSNWPEVDPASKYAYVTTLSTDTIIKVDADVSENGCPDTSNPLDKYVYDTTKHDGPCDMTISPDNTAWSNWLCIPDIYSGLAHDFWGGLTDPSVQYKGDSVTLLNTNNLSDVVILYLPRCRDDTQMLSFMTTIDPFGNYPYCFVESFESLLGGNSGSESVIDMRDPRNPVEIVRFVQDDVMNDIANKCPNAVQGADGNYYLPNGAQLKGGIGRNAYTDEFSKMMPGAKKYNFLNNWGSGDLTVIDVKTLEVIKTIGGFPAGSKIGAGDFSRDGKKYFVGTGPSNSVCRIDVASLTLELPCTNIGTFAMGDVVK